MTVSEEDKTEETITEVRAGNTKAPQSSRSSRHGRGTNRLTFNSLSHSN